MHIVGRVAGLRRLFPWYHVFIHSYQGKRPATKQPKPTYYGIEHLTPKQTLPFSSVVARSERVSSWHLQRLLLFESSMELSPRCFGGMLMTTWWIKPMCSNRRPKDCIHVSLLARSLGNVTKDLSLLSLALKLMLTTHLVDGCADIWQLRLTSHNFKAYFCALQSLNESTTLGFAFSFTMNQWTRWT